MTAKDLPRDRDVWRIAAPMILSNVSVPLLGMVDTGVVGHLESAVYLGAVAIGGTRSLTTRATITEMLSGPPRRFAKSTSV